MLLKGVASRMARAAGEVEPGTAEKRNLSMSYMALLKRARPGHAALAVETANDVPELLTQVLRCTCNYGGVLELLARRSTVQCRLWGEKERRGKRMTGPGAWEKFARYYNNDSADVLRDLHHTYILGYTSQYWHYMYAYSKMENSTAPNVTAAVDGRIVLSEAKRTFRHRRHRFNYRNGTHAAVDMGTKNYGGQDGWKYGMYLESRQTRQPVRDVTKQQYDVCTRALKTACSQEGTHSRFKQLSTPSDQFVTAEDAGTHRVNAPERISGRTPSLSSSSLPCLPSYSLV
jgi:hypothetical protein